MSNESQHSFVYSVSIGLPTSPCLRLNNRERVRIDAHYVPILFMEFVPVEWKFSIDEFTMARKVECCAQLGSWKLGERMEKEVIEGSNDNIGQVLCNRLAMQ